MDKFSISGKICIHLKKQIPTAAGLGGGSSDCAATLIGMNALFSLGIPPHKLAEIGVSFGADVPFFLTTTTGTTLAEGIGDIITPLTSPPPCWIVLACPDIAVSTADVFSQYVATDVRIQPDIPGLIQAITTQNWAKIANYTKNALSSVTELMHPIITEIIQKMHTLGAYSACMSGSGPSVFGIFDSYDHALKAQQQMKNILFNVFLTRTGV